MTKFFRRDDESNSEFTERLERCEATAGRWFSDATKDQLARFNERMEVARAYKGAPKWDRFRDAAKREFERTTAAASALCDATMAEIMNDGEVSEALSYRWDELEFSRLMQAAE